MAESVLEYLVAFLKHKEMFSKNSVKVENKGSVAIMHVGAGDATKTWLLCTADTIPKDFSGERLFVGCAANDTKGISQAIGQLKKNAAARILVFSAKGIKITHVVPSMYASSSDAEIQKTVDTLLLHAVE